MSTTGRRCWEWSWYSLGLAKRFSEERPRLSSLRHQVPPRSCTGCSDPVPSGNCPVCTPIHVTPPPGSSQVFILKVVKVLCFETLLQVFILKGLTAVIMRLTQKGARLPLERAGLRWTYFFFARHQQSTGYFPGE